MGCVAKEECGTGIHPNHLAYACVGAMTRGSSACGSTGKFIMNLGVH